MIARFDCLSDAVACADEYWEYFRGSAQLWNIDRGDVDQIEHWEDLSPSGVATRIERLGSFADQAAALTTPGIGDRDRSLLAAIEFSGQPQRRCPSNETWPWSPARSTSSRSSRC